MRSVVFVCVALLAAASAIELSSSVRTSAPKASVAPGLRGVLSQNGANYLLDAFLPVVFAKVQGLQIPEIDGESKVPILGKVKYYVKNINVDSVSYGSASIGMQNDFSMDVEGVEVKISADWEYKQKSWPHIKSSGSADIKISNSAVAIALSTGITPSGDPQLEVQSVDANFKDLSVKIHGSILSWLYDLLFDIAKNQIKKAAAKSVESELTNLINTMADAALAKLKLVVPVSKTIAVDFSLTDAPAFPNADLTVDLKGQFQNITNPSPAPLPHVSFPSAAPTQHVLIQMDQFLFNSGLWLLYESGKLDWTVTQKDIPAKIPFHLNTTTFASVLPALEKAFPSAAIEWKFSPLTVPSANFTEKGLAVGAVFAMDWLATNPSGQYVEAFTAELDFSVVAALAINSTSLTGNLTVTDLNLELMSSSIGPVDLTTLNFFLTTIVEGPLVDILNAIFAQGLPLPSFAGISLADANFSYFPQYAEFSANLHVPTAHQPAVAVQEAPVRFN